MKIAILARADLRAEMETWPLPGELHRYWAKDFADLLMQQDAAVVFDMEFYFDLQRLEALRSFFPRPVFVNSVLHCCGEMGPGFVRINGWPGFLGGGCLELACSRDQDVAAAGKLMGTLGLDFRLVPDTSGMVSPRIVSMIINEAYYTLAGGISGREEIDLAMTLGTGIPRGPFNWARMIGLKNVVDLLTRLCVEDPRYSVCPALEAESGKAL